MESSPCSQGRKPPSGRKTRTRCDILSIQMRNGNANSLCTQLHINKRLDTLPGYRTFFAVVCISLTADGPQRARFPILPTGTLSPYLRSLRTFPSLLCSRLAIFHRDASSAPKICSSSTNNGCTFFTEVLSLSATEVRIKILLWQESNSRLKVPLDRSGDEGRCGVWILSNFAIIHKQYQYFP